MKLTHQQKKIIRKAVETEKTQHKTITSYAKYLGIDKTTLRSFIENKKDLSLSQYMRVARRLKIELNRTDDWATAKTEVFEYLQEQFIICQKNGISAILADVPDIGKTHTARWYASNTPGAIYIDCSQVKSKQKLVRSISAEFDLDATIKYQDVYDDLVFYLNSVPGSLIILDEAGDLEYPAFLEMKALWNATEGSVGYFLMGADGLKTKIEGGLSRKRLGFAEMFSRLGTRFQRVSPVGGDGVEFKQRLVAQIAYANGMLQDMTTKAVLALHKDTSGSLRRLRIEYKKQKN